MASVTFILKNPSANTETPILLVFWVNRDRIRLSTSEKIHPKHWNAKTHRARETIKYDQWESLNGRLNDIESKAIDKFREYLSQHSVIYLKTLKNEFKSIVHPITENKPPLMTFLRSIEENIQTVNRNLQTINHYQRTLNILTEYQLFKGQEVDFNDINLDFYANFTHYLEKELNLALNTIGSHIKNIKLFMNYALEKGYTANTGHLHRKFKKLGETSDTIYLNENELNYIYKLDLSGQKRLEQQRDLFIIGCYTGLRFSDLSHLEQENIIKNWSRIRVKTSKTGEIVEIPLHRRIKAILEKYNWTLPKSISDQKMNEYLKDIGELAGLNEIVVKSITRGGKREESKHQKWELITVHTARRSFATNAYLAGVPTISIMKITGHRTESAFMKYIKISQEQNADLLSSHPFFSTNPNIDK